MRAPTKSRTAAGRACFHRYDPNMDSEILNIEEIVMGGLPDPPPEAPPEKPAEPYKPIILNGPPVKLPTVSPYQHENLQCFQCFITFCSAKAKERHMKKSHREEYKQQLQQGNTLFTCYVCDRTFLSSEELTLHQPTHSKDDKPFKCVHCKESFKTFSELTAHRRQVCPEKQLVCKDCNETFRSAGLLRTHRLTQHPRPEADATAAAAAEQPEGVAGKTHSCKKCGHGFDTEPELVAHQQKYPEGQQCNGSTAAAKKRGRPSKTEEPAVAAAEKKGKRKKKDEEEAANAGSASESAETPAEEKGKTGGAKRGRPSKAAAKPETDEKKSPEDDDDDGGDASGKEKKPKVEPAAASRQHPCPECELAFPSLVQLRAQILHSSSIHELAVDLPEAQWKASLQAKQEMANLGYSLPDKNSCNNTLLFIPDYRLAEGLSNRIPHNQSQDFSTTSSHNSSERSGSLSGGKGGKKKKTKAGSKPTKANGSNWANVPLPPPPVHPLPGTEMDLYPNEHHEGGGYESDGWGPPMPVQTYLHQGMEDELEEEEERVPTPPIRGVASSPAAVSFGQQSTATLTPSPRDEMQPMLQAHLDEITRAYQLDMAKQTWHMQGGSLPPQAPAPPVGYVSSTMVSDLETDLPDEDEEDEDEDEDEGYGARHPRGIEHTPGSSMDNLDSSLTGKGLSHRPRPSSPFSTDGSTVGTHSLGHPRATRPSRKPRSQGTAPHRRDAGADDLPPPPEPPPSQGQGRIQGARSISSMVPPTDRKASSLERPSMSGPLSGQDDMRSSIDRQTRTSLEHHLQAQDRLGSMERAEDGRRGHKTEEGCLPYSKPSFPSPGGHSSSGTTSSKGSTGPRKTDGPRQPQQWTAIEHADFLGSGGQGQYSGEL